MNLKPAVGRCWFGRAPSIDKLLRGLLVCGVLGAGSGALVFAQDQQALCVRGEGHFEARLHGGAGVVVGPEAEGAFASRMCSARLTWKGKTVLQAARAGEIDLDVMGADLGFGVPVAAFQIREAYNDWRASYEIYSLERTPRLLAKLVGGDFYRAVDANFNGRIAIWTSDAGAVEGLDGLGYADFDQTPAIALRYEDRRLTDVSAEYPSQYDRQVAKARSLLTPQGLAAFQASDGKLEDGYRPWGSLIALRKTKAEVLAIVWGYLYSGREQQAWSELAGMWPANDEERAKSAILAARAKGFETQVARVAGPASGHHRWRLTVYDTTGTSPAMQEASHEGNTRYPADPLQMDVSNGVVDISPQPIAMMRTELTSGPETVVLVIDAAGKVQSVGQGTSADPELLQAAKAWKFIPGFKGGRSVACRLKMDVEPYR